MSIKMETLARLQSMFNRPLFRTRCRGKETLASNGVRFRGEVRPNTVLVRLEDNKLALGRMADVLPLKGNPSPLVLQEGTYAGTTLHPVLYRDKDNIAHRVWQRTNLSEYTLEELIAPPYRELVPFLSQKDWGLVALDSGHLKTNYDHDHSYCLGQAQDRTIEINFPELMAALGYVPYTGHLPEAMRQYSNLWFMHGISLPPTIRQTIGLAVDANAEILARTVAVASRKKDPSWLKFADLVAVIGVPVSLAIDQPKIMPGTPSENAFRYGQDALQVLDNQEKKGGTAAFVIPAGSGAEEPDPKGGKVDWN